jgi:protein-disulfide isomerase
MRLMMRALLGALALAAVAMSASPASAQALTNAQKDEVRAVVRDYLRQNPQVVEEAMQELERRREAARRVRIEGDARDFSIGPRNAPVTIVEFFDYRCPYCHDAMTWLFEVTRRNPQTVRVIFKEMPVLGEPSLEASRAAIASIKQGRYIAFHRNLMTFRGQLDSQQIDAVARRSGIDVARLRRDMGEMQTSPITGHLESNLNIASESGIDGTPTFLINGKWVRGWNRAEADKLLAEALRDARKR